MDKAHAWLDAIFSFSFLSNSFPQRTGRAGEKIKIKIWEKA